MAKKNPDPLIVSLKHENTGIACSIHKKKGVKKLTLRVNRQGEVRLTLPFLVSFEEGRAFLEEKKPWIFHHVLQIKRQKAASLKNLFMQQRQVLLQGQRVLVRLEEYAFLKKPKLLYRAGILSEAPHFSLNLPKNLSEEAVYSAMKEGFKKIAKTELSRMLAEVSKETGIAFRRLTVRDTVSRWGSCSGEGNISLCWRLIMAPHETARYVMIHELCHRKEPNHSPRFWAWVSQFCHLWKEHRRWLKTEGVKLFDF